MKYYNYLTTPSGEYCTLHEITNEDYLVIVKFLESDNKKETLNVLDSHIKETIPNFDDFDIINKAYIYMIFVFYNIRGYIQYKNNKIGNQQIPITQFLDCIESVYNKDLYIEVELNDDMSVGCSYPSKFFIEDNSIIIDYTSGIRDVTLRGQKYTFSPEEREKFVASLPHKDISCLNDIITENVKIVTNVLEGVQLSNLTFNIVSSDIISLCLMMLKMPLDEFYHEIYVMSHYVKISRHDYLQMTPMESSIIFNQFIKDKEEQKERETEAKGMKLPYET